MEFKIYDKAKWQIEGDTPIPQEKVVQYFTALNQ